MESASKLRHWLLQENGKRKFIFILRLTCYIFCQFRALTTNRYCRINYIQQHRIIYVVCVFVFKINFDYKKLFRASRFRQDFRVEKNWFKKWCWKSKFFVIVAYDRAEILKSQIGTEFERKIHFYGAGLIDASVHSIHFSNMWIWLAFFRNSNLLLKHVELKNNELHNYT